MALDHPDPHSSLVVKLLDRHTERLVNQTPVWALDTLLQGGLAPAWSNQLYVTLDKSIS